MKAESRPTVPCRADYYPEAFIYKGRRIEVSVPFLLAVSSAGRHEYASIVKIDGQSEVCVNGRWELLGSVERAMQIIDAEAEQ